MYISFIRCWVHYEPLIGKALLDSILTDWALKPSSFCIWLTTLVELQIYLDFFYL
jgi:hypothetical protein